MIEFASSFVELTKPKVTLLNLAVAITCFVLAAYPKLDFSRVMVFAFAGYLACGGCCALNCFYDKDSDKLMERTSRRAIPSGRISPRSALLFGLVLITAGVAISIFFLNALTGIMIVAGFIFYIGVYTVILKRISSLNVVIGGLAGCFAALSGWTAAVNTLSLVPIVVSAIDFLWTPGHLWGLAIKKMKEYKKAGIPMLPVKVGISKTAQIIFLFNLSTIGVSLLLPLTGFSGRLYFAVALVAGGWFAIESQRLLASPSETHGFRVFVSSMPYLLALMVGLLLDRILFAGT